MLVMSSRNAFVKSYIPGCHCDFLRAMASMKMGGVLKVVYTGNGRRSQCVSWTYDLWTHLASHVTVQ